MYGMPAAKRYQVLRGRIRSGDLLLWTHRLWASWYDFKVQMVRVFTRSRYCHVATAFVMGGRVWVLEAVQPVPRMVPLSNLLPAYIVPLRAPWKSETERFALSLVGKPRAIYSEAEAVRGFLGKVKPGEDDNWMCAEMSWCIAKSDGIDLGADITPSGIEQAALELGSSVSYLGTA
jgi:hypothetical protein